MTKTATPSSLDEMAARWALRVDAGGLSVAEEAELSAWTSADVRHAGAFARAMAANAYLDRAAALGALDADVGGEPTAPRAVSRRVWIGGAGGALAAALIGTVALSGRQPETRIDAPIGSQRRTALDDGSAVTLNTGAQIALAFAPVERRVRLLAGEVNFDVAKDRSRPFVVEAGATTVRVIGTSFIVRREQETVAVTVREGIVEVRHGMLGHRLLAGDRLVTGHGADRLVKLSSADVERAGLWQRGEIDLTGMTLDDAAREYARYSDRHILIADSAVGHLKVAGVYATSDPMGFARAAALAQGLTASDVPGGIRLAR